VGPGGQRQRAEGERLAAEAAAGPAGWARRLASWAARRERAGIKGKKTAAAGLLRVLG
jgi:hypothetical protein